MNTTQGRTRPLNAARFIAAIAWFIFTLVLFCLPGSEIPEVEGWWNQIYLDKWIHVGIFAILGYLFMLPFLKSGIPSTEKRAWFMRITISCILWGLTVEFIQRYFVAGRSFDLIDWASDSLGAFLALIYMSYRLKKS